MTTSRRTSRGPVPGRGPVVEKHRFLISRSILLRMRNVSDKRLYIKSKHTLYFQYIFPKIVPVMK